MLLNFFAAQQLTLAKLFSLSKIDVCGAIMIVSVVLVRAARKFDSIYEQHPTNEVNFQNILLEAVCSRFFTVFSFDSV